MAERKVNSLVHYTKTSYDGSFRSDLLEQYKLYVQSAENVSARRIASTRYLLALNAALVALYGLKSSGTESGCWTLLIHVVGVLGSILWHPIIRSHRDLNSIQFKVIHELEEHLPAALFTYEWEEANRGQGSAYRAVTQIELWIPVAFFILHLILALRCSLMQPA